MAYVTHIPRKLNIEPNISQSFDILERYLNIKKISAYQTDIISHSTL